MGIGKTHDAGLKQLTSLTDSTLAHQRYMLDTMGLVGSVSVFQYSNCEHYDKGKYLKE